SCEHAACTANANVNVVAIMAASIPRSRRPPRCSWPAARAARREGTRPSVPALRPASEFLSVLCFALVPFSSPHLAILFHRPTIPNQATSSGDNRMSKKLLAIATAPLFSIGIAAAQSTSGSSDQSGSSTSGSSNSAGQSGQSGSSSSMGSSGTSSSDTSSTGTDQNSTDTSGKKKHKKHKNSSSTSDQSGTSSSTSGSSSTPDQSSTPH